MAICSNKMKKILIILFLCFFLIPGEIKDNTLIAIKSFYGKDTKIVSKTFKIPKTTKKEIQNKVRQKFYRDKIYYWVIKKNGEIKGYALLDNSIGKTQPITYLVIFNLNGEVINSKIIKYRESYGGQVKSKKWLRQFNGMKKDSLYSHPKDITGITGATLSVKSVTKGISKLSLLLPHIIKDYNNGN